MSEESELLAKWYAEKEAYRRWGSFVSCHIMKLIAARLDPRAAGHFVRIPVGVRLKDDESLLQKAFHRGKNYRAPYEEIEDKVGIRFVLLLGQDVRLVGGAIESECEAWTVIKARDHEDEIASSPYEFNYQSLHFIVRSKAGLSWEEQDIPAGLPCEIQVRTLLQHAYSEVTHDTLYKPSIKTTPAMKRAAAKSMALLEATGDYFEDLDALIADQVRPLRVLLSTLSDEYVRLVGKAAAAQDSALNDLVLDRYGHDVNPDELVEWLGSRAYIGTRISERTDRMAIFRIPSVLLVYYSVGIAPNGTPVDCPISYTDLELIYGDLGLSLEG